MCYSMYELHSFALPLIASNVIFVTTKKLRVNFIRYFVVNKQQKKLS